MAARWFRTRGGAPGRVRKSLDRALAGVELAGSRAIAAELARDAADLVDSARAAQDPKLWAQAAGRLDVLVGRLGLDVSGPSGDGGAGVVEPDDGLADLLGAGPAVGDGTES